MTMTMEQALSVIDRSIRTLREAGYPEQADELTEARRPVSAQFAQPAQSMDVDMVERACVAHYESWSVFHQWEREAFRRDMKHALTAAIQEKGNG